MGNYSVLLSLKTKNNFSDIPPTKVIGAFTYT